MQSLTNKQQEQLEHWIEEVRLCEQSALKWAKALWEIHQSGLWRVHTDNWAEFCDKTFGYSKSRAYEYVNAINFIEDQKLLAEKNPEVEVPASLSAVKRLKVETRPGRVTKPKPVKLKPVNGATVEPPVKSAAPIDLRSLLATMDKEFDRLLHRQDIPFEALRLIQHLNSELRQAREMLQGVLPGFEQVVAKFRKPRLEEVQLFCAKAGIAPKDADWFWNKMEGNGWKNGGKAVADWQRTLTAWRLAGHFPSQKQFLSNGAQVPKPRTIQQNEMDRMQREVSRL